MNLNKYENQINIITYGGKKGFITPFSNKDQGKSADQSVSCSYHSHTISCQISNRNLRLDQFESLEQNVEVIKAMCIW